MSKHEEEGPHPDVIFCAPAGHFPLRRWSLPHVYLPGILCRGFLILCLYVLAPWGSAGWSIAQEVSEEQALVWFKAGDFDRAQDAFQQLLALHPHNPVALYHLGQMESDGADAEQYYLQLLYHTPPHPYADDALLAIVQLQYRNGRYREAAQTCNRLLASYPETRINDQARYWLGRALLSDHRPALARLTFLQLLSVHPQSQYVMHTRLGIADTFRAEGAFIDAARAYLKFESEYRESDSLRVALFRAGACLEAANRQFEADHVYQRLIDRFPDIQEAEEARRRNEREGK